MKLLAIDTSSASCSIGLLLDDKKFISHQTAPMQQAKLILPVIEDLLREHQVTLGELDAIAFGCGPGSFTGVRIAISVAQGLAYAANVPMISVSSLAALAQAAYEDLGLQKILAVIDARINEVYYGAYVVNAAGVVELVGKEIVAAPESVVFPVEKDWCGVGNGWEVYRDKLRYQPVKMDVTREAMASGVLTLARVKWERGECVSAGEAVPVYLRDEVAVKGK